MSKIINKYQWEGQESFVRPLKAFRTSPITSDEIFVSLGGIITQVEINDPPAVNDEAFKIACRLFKEVCTEISEFIHNPEFKGGFEDYSSFLASEEAKADPVTMTRLAVMWSGANEYAKYEGSKLGYGQPEWWYKCWEYPED